MPTQPSEITNSYGSALFYCGCGFVTQPNQIAGSYVSPEKYKSFNCDYLLTEANNLARRENSILIAQEQRYKTNQVQTFWGGHSIEAVELANIRGEKNAIFDAMNKKDCNVPSGTTKPKEKNTDNFNIDDFN